MINNIFLRSLLIIFALISICSAIIVQDNNNSLAQVEQIENVYVFILSKPKNQYERLGTVTKNFALTGSNREMIEGLISKAKNEYSQCQGIIISGYIFDKCEVVKFKN